MDILIITLICTFGLLCLFDLKFYLKNSKTKIRSTNSSDDLVDGYLDIIDNVDNLDEAVLLRDNLVLRMRQNKAKRENPEMKLYSKVVNFSDYQSGKNRKTLKKF